MTGTTKTIDMQMSIITRSTVASVSKVDYSKKNQAKDQTGFDGLLNKASSAMIQAKSTTVGISYSSTEKLVARQDTTRNDQNAQNLSKKLNDKSGKSSDVNDPNKAKANTAAKDQDTKNIDDRTTEATDKNLEKTATTDTNTNETSSKDANKKLQNAIEEDTKEMVAHIAKMFDISEEEIVDAMDMLGIMMTDLLNPQNIRELITNLDTQDKALDLLTDADLNTNMQDLFEDAEGMKSQLMKEFDLSNEDVLTAINENTQKVDPELKNIKVKEPEIVLHAAKEELPQDLKASQSKDLTSDIKVETPEISSEEVFKPVENTGEMTKQNGKNTGNEQNTNNPGATLFNQLLDNITENMDTAKTGATEYTNRAQMENILRQITDRITIRSFATESSMELSLHPASLGNLNILLTSSKDGITAKFTAQNEIVKEAVEAQMQTLQQKFNEQGIKVTSIEVTIASHAFEQNLQQGSDNNEAYNKEQARKARPLRRINLAEELVEDDEGISDADRIAAQMMAANGNSVDFSA
nr:flagellar hook-length control protein FliK [uncultured Butyrivibrio sp.]